MKTTLRAAVVPLAIISLVGSLFIGATVPAQAEFTWVVNVDNAAGSLYSGQGGLPAPGNYWNDGNSAWTAPLDSEGNVTDVRTFQEKVGEGNWGNLNGPINNALNQDGYYADGAGTPVLSHILLPSATATDTYSVAGYVAIPSYAHTIGQSQIYTFNIGGVSATATTVPGVGGATLVEGQNYAVLHNVSPTLATAGTFSFDPTYAGYYLTLETRDDNGGINSHLAGLQVAQGEYVPPALTLVETGGLFFQNNWADPTAGGTAFAKDLIPGNLAAHQIDHLNDLTYGNGNSWIGNSTPTFAGVSFGEARTVGAVAFGRDNLGGFNDRTAGDYTLQYTTVANPDASTPDVDWTDVGTVTLADGGADSLRKVYELTDPVADATGMRLLLSAGNVAIDEIEVYPEFPRFVRIRANTAGGYSVGWDGNDGDHFGVGSPAPVPDNRARPLAVNNYAVAIGGSELQPGPTGTHQIIRATDGLYGNSNSWISGAGPAYIGVDLNGRVAIDAIAFGRDNGDPTGPCGGGQCTDRNLGTYTVQHTLMPNPGPLLAVTGDPTTGWATVGDIEYLGPEDVDVGGGFTPWLRHQFAVGKDGAGVEATGLRVMVSPTNIAIDELEVYGTELTVDPSFGEAWQDETVGAPSLVLAGTPIPEELGYGGDGLYHYISPQSPAEFVWKPGIVGTDVEIKASWGVSFNHNNNVEYLFDPDGPNGPEPLVSVVQGITQTRGVANQQSGPDHQSGEPVYWSGFLTLGEFDLTLASEFQVIGWEDSVTTSRPTNNPWALSSAIWSVPEPSSFALALLGLLGIASCTRRRRNG